MRMRRGTLRLSASDLMGFKSCRHAATLDLRQLEDRDLEPAINGEEAELLRRQGDKHELAYLAGLRQAGRSVIEIPKGGFASSVLTSSRARRWAEGRTYCFREHSSTVSGEDIRSSYRRWIVFPPWTTSPTRWWALS